MCDLARAQHRPNRLRAGFELEYNPCDPKEGELYLCRTKVVERLLEVRSGSNVQIDRQI